MNTIDYLQTDYQQASELYSTAPPKFIGRFVLSQIDAKELPIDLGEVYDTVDETIQKNLDIAMQHAATFGALNVGVALDGRYTDYRFDAIDSYKPGYMAEIATTAMRSVDELFCAPDIDSSTTYLLADDGEPSTVEMGLIQALHMVDTALVTDRYTGAAIVRTATTEEIVRLRSDYPDDVLLRVYGDVRGQFGTKLLGSVVPTELVERARVFTSRPDGPSKPAEPTRERIEIAERRPAAFVGITIAKRPHIGHGLLLVKAIAEAGKDGTIVVELNDRGPRVMAALVKLAKDTDTSIETVMQQVSDGSIGFDAIERAYKVREDSPSPQTNIDYKLQESEQYYRQLLTAIMPEQLSYDAIADSDLEPQLATLARNPGYTDLFSGSGMALLGNDKKEALPVVTNGQPTIAGILGALSTRYALRLVDSPPPLTTANRKLFSDAGLNIEQSTGTGIMFDFVVGSGTNGNTTSIESLFEVMDATECDRKLLLPALRLLMNNGYLLPSDGNSRSLNFANRDTAIAAFSQALKEVSAMDDPEKILYESMKLVDIKPELVKSMVRGVYNPQDFPAKTTGVEVQTILTSFPQLTGNFSQQLMAYVQENPSNTTVPKSAITDNDRRFMQQLRQLRADTYLPVLSDLAGQNTDEFATLTSESLLIPVMQTMGYAKNQTVEFLNKIAGAKGIYKLT